MWMVIVFGFLEWLQFCFGWWLCGWIDEYFVNVVDVGWFIVVLVWGEGEEVQCDDFWVMYLVIFWQQQGEVVYQWIVGVWIQWLLFWMDVWWQVEVLVVVGFVGVCGVVDDFDVVGVYGYFLVGFFSFWLCWLGVVV